jgi:hypothetical protein
MLISFAWNTYCIAKFAEGLYHSKQPNRRGRADPHAARLRGMPLALYTDKHAEVPMQLRRYGINDLPPRGVSCP